MYRVNICTHLKKRDKKTGAVVNAPKNMRQIKYGNTYPVPIYSANFPVWTGIKRGLRSSEREIVRLELRQV